MSRTLRGLAVAGLALFMVVVATPRVHAQSQAQTPVDAAAFELVTPAEAQAAARSEAANPLPIKPRTRSVPRQDITAIRVVTPNAPGTPVPAPLRIELAFKAAPGARIVPASFRVFYGVLKIDLTERLRGHSSVSESGVVVERAQVPEGSHRLFVQVADDQGNTAEQELLIRVGSAS